MTSRLLSTFAAALLCAPLAASAQGFFGQNTAPHSTHGMPAQCDNARFLADQQGLEQSGPTGIDLPEHLCGQVLAVSPRAKRTRSGWHGYFYLSVGQGVSIRIVSDLDQMNAPQWPWVSKGDQVEVQGRYYYDSLRRQGVDWTHHGTGRKWPWPGYVVVNGTRYQ
ncbi:DUF3465 domain-containing protein [Gluconobacter kondonii]|uniref:DUF3465 domain-containing protein n=1 Tax=Gluconobacter kondonii TaxID=941463 RepID=UPI001B8AB02F|nr:DUF3465 domain-containing protein [Gluconobacter kondonii]MBS1053339.1 DUF3465 domain-containing protein [Gluconobacter kondonii]MBS1055776.1 DUF3465 domain-containing protein [Gluconobacter kondonii]MBS1076521.1 DUF3465 domain-containing protein [Gluconobacter kondonii]